MIEKGTICLRCTDRATIFKEFSRIFRNFTITEKNGVITLQNVSDTEIVRFTMNFVSYEYEFDDFIKKKFNIDGYLSKFQKAPKAVVRILRTRHAKTTSYIIFQIPGKLSNTNKSRLLTIAKKFNGMAILDGKKFFDGDGHILLDERGYSEFDNSVGFESPDKVSFRFNSEKYAKKNGLLIPHNLPFLKEVLYTRSEREICKRIAAILVRTVRADDLSIGKPISVANTSARNIIQSYTVDREWFSKNELRFLVNSTPTKGEVIKYLNGYNELLALMFAIGLVDEFKFPHLDCNYEDIVEVLKSVNSFELLLSKAKLRTDIAKYLDLIYVTQWNLEQAYRGNGDLVSIRQNVVTSWYKALKWLYFYDEVWDDVETNV